MAIQRERNHYKQVQPLSREKAESIFLGEARGAIPDALLHATFHDPDWHWLQEWCLRYTNHANPEIQKMAILCLGHLARIHRKIDLERVVPILIALTKDTVVGGIAEDALDDIQMFVLPTEGSR